MAWGPTASQNALPRSGLAFVYTDFVDKVVALLLQVEEIDREVWQINEAKPFQAGAAKGDGRRLRSVEAQARGAGGFGPDQLSIVRDMKLPYWALGDGLAWPPHRPLLAGLSVRERQG